MNPLRLVLVTRRFWPLVDEADGLLARLAVAWVQRGMEVTVLTARWHSDWPYQIDFQGVRVLRLPFSNRLGWGALRYMRSLTAWLKSQCGHFDLVCTSGLRHDAYATLAAGKGRFPVALRVDRAGLSGDCHWQLDATFGYRIKRRCFKADALVAAGQPIERELIAAGYPRDRIHFIPNGVDMPPPIAPPERAAAKDALAEACPLLSLTSQSQLAVYLGPLDDSKGLRTLIQAWRGLVARRPNARLWLVGEGPDSGALLAYVDAQGLSSWIVLPGAFDDDEDLFKAADVFVLPSLEEGMSYPLLRAMATGVPVVATDIPGNRLLIEHEYHGLLTPVEDAAALAGAVERVFDNPHLAAMLGAAARTRVAEEFALATTVDEHLRLFDSLVHSRLDATHR